MKQHTESDIATMFDSIAPRYDFLNRLLSVQQDVRWRRQLIREIPTCHQGFYVDVATGTGDVLIAAEKARKGYTRFLGLDISEKMLQLADQKRGGLSFELQKASAESIPLETNSVDCLSISFGLRNVIQKEQAIREFQRVLKPGGTLLILEFFTPEGIASKVFEWYFHHVLPRIGGLFSQASAYRYLPDSVLSFYSHGQLVKRLQDNGFALTGEKKFLFGGCRLLVAQKRVTGS